MQAMMDWNKTQTSPQNDFFQDAFEYWRLSRAMPFWGRPHVALLVKFFLRFSPSGSIYHLQQVMFCHWVPYTLNDPHSSVVPIGEGFVRTFSHENPLVTLPLTLNDLPVQLLQLLVDLDLAERGSCIIFLALPDKELANGFRKAPQGLFT